MYCGKFSVKRHLGLLSRKTFLGQEKGHNKMARYAPAERLISFSMDTQGIPSRLSKPRFGVTKS